MNAEQMFDVWSLVPTVESLTHYTQNLKYAVIFHTQNNFFHNCHSFPIVLYMGNDFHNNIFCEKIFSVLCVVCKGL